MVKSLSEWLKENDSLALERWLRRLNGSAKATRRTYLRHFRLFCTRYGLTPEQLYQLRLKEVQSGDPLVRGQVRDMVIGLLREMKEGRRDGWPEDAQALVRPGPKSPSTCHQVTKAVVSFFETFESLELNIKAKDQPHGSHLGQRGISAEEIALALDSAGAENKLRNRAIVLFLKDSGLRRSDLPLLNVGDYKSATRRDVEGETFLVFKDPLRTQKEGIHACVHIGPEAVKAVDEYLKKERGDAGPEDPLFTMREPKRKGATGGKADLRINDNAVGTLVKRMMNTALGPDARRRSAHSLRKFHRTALTIGGLGKQLIDKLQGKAQDTYLRVEDYDLDALFSAYVKAYDKLRVFKSESAAVKNLREELEAQRKHIEDLKKGLEEARRAATFQMDPKSEAVIWAMLEAVDPGDEESVRRIMEAAGLKTKPRSK